jgi:hypothetical protein
MAYLVQKFVGPTVKIQFMETARTVLSTRRS